MKKKQEIEYNSKAELISMILRLWDNISERQAKQRLMSFLLSNYRGTDLSTKTSLDKMPYDELEKMYNAMCFVMKG
jgi:hypothetical protein